MSIADSTVYFLQNKSCRLNLLVDVGRNPALAQLCSQGPWGKGGAAKSILKPEEK